MKISRVDYEILAEGYVAMLRRGVITPKQFLAYLSTLRGAVGNAHPARPLWDEWEGVER